MPDDKHTDFKASVARLRSALENSELDDGYHTPDDYVDPPRDSRTAFFLDKKLERKVLDQQAAIKKTIPQWIAHHTKRPLNSQAEADRWLSKYRAYHEEIISLGQATGEIAIYFRDLAENQVRWGGTPKQALKILLATVP